MDRPEYLDRGEPARLIPIVADTNREARAASIFLATLVAVPPFAQEVLKAIGQRAGSRSSIRAFTEIRFRNEEKINLRPDGLIVLESGRGSSWNALVETKIGNAELTSEQVEGYLQIAKANSLQALLTISNQFVGRPTHSPVKVSKPLLRNVDIFHLSWVSIRTIAYLLLQEARFDSAEQRFVLSEFYRYFSHDSVGVSRFDRMNSEWKDVVGKINARATLGKTSSEVENTVGAWHQETRDICLLMSEKVNRPVHLRLSRLHAEDATQRLRADSERLVRDCDLGCVLEIPDAASPLDIRVNIRERSIRVSMSLVAPKDKKRASSRINWLLRQLAKVDAEDIYIKCAWPGRTQSTQATLTAARDRPEILIAEGNVTAPVSFEVFLHRDIAGKFSGPKSFIEQLEDAVPAFYAQVGEWLRAYVPAPPRLQEKGQSVDDESEPVISEVRGLPIAAPPPSAETE